jgi:hypothetical protein
VLLATAPHAPLSTPDCFNDALQAMQDPLHAALQQTPSTQNPERHCAAVEQACASWYRGMQVPASHHAAAMQWADVVHDVPQASPVQRKSPQSCAALSMHEPNPLQPCDVRMP